MKSIRNLPAVAALAASLAACGGTTFIGNSFGGNHLLFRDGLLKAHVKGLPDAAISAAGELSIADKAVAVTPAQHEQLKKYYRQAVDLRRAGIETGKAGASMSAHAIGAIASGLAHGDPNSIGPKIDAQAEMVEAKALAICENLDALQKTQDAVAASLPEFKPYAAIVIRDDDADCHSQRAQKTKA
jgi:hypothetical protein